jgi:hypothetical protein
LCSANPLIFLAGQFRVGAREVAMGAVVRTTLPWPESPALAGLSSLISDGLAVVAAATVMSATSTVSAAASVAATSMAAA